MYSSCRSAQGGGGDSADGGGGFDMGGVIKMIGGLTNKGDGQGGSDGFMQLLQGAGGSGGRAYFLTKIVLTVKYFPRRWQHSWKYCPNIGWFSKIILQCQGKDK